MLGAGMLRRTVGSVAARRQAWGASVRLSLVRSLSSLPPYTVLSLPALSPTMEEGKIANWLKAEGDALSAGQSVCEIETDKSTMDFEMQDDGFLAKILVQAGDDSLPVGSAIGVLVEEEGDVAAFKNVSISDIAGASPAQASTSAPTPDAAPESPKPKETAADSPSPSTPPTANVTQSSSGTGTQVTVADGATAPPAPVRADGTRVVASPLARLIAAQQGLDLTTVTGTGPDGRIIRADIEETLARAPAATDEVPASAQRQGAAADGSYFDLPVGSDAQQIAMQLAKSKLNVPHYNLTSEIDVSAVLALRAELNQNLAEDEQISVNDFIVRAAALCMNRVPEVNSSWGETFIRQYRNADINVAVISADENAMLMPVIRAANNKGLGAIARESREFLDAADGKAAIDFGVGSFTITNMGVFGLKTVTPIVREPQACSLGVGAITQRVVPGVPDENYKPTIQSIHTMSVTMSCDHRVVDGAVGAAWLQEFKQLLEKPLQMLL